MIGVKGALSPIAAGNFVALSECGYYDGVVFHRTVPGSSSRAGRQFGRIQDVDPTGTVGTGGPRYTIKDEPVTTTYHRGTVAMARTAEPDSVGSQFFIVLDDAAASRRSSPRTTPTRSSARSPRAWRSPTRSLPPRASRRFPTNPVAITDGDASPTPEPTTPVAHANEPPAPRRRHRMTKVVIATEIGDIEADLFTDGAPKTAQNFVDLANKGFYDDVIFHRVIPGFVIQGGDGEHGKKASLNPSRVGTGGPGYKFADEPITGDYYRGTLAMANSGPNTNGSQFFICHQDLVGKLPKNYTIFGQVTKGLDVVDAIANAPRNGRDLPDAPVAMTSVTVLDEG